MLDVAKLRPLQYQIRGQFLESKKKWRVHERKTKEE
jgi:hypothetical protein